LSNDAEESLDRGTRGWPSKSEPICRHAQHEVLEQSSFCMAWDSYRIPDTFMHVSVTALAALKPTVTKSPRPVMTACGT
jgi:hypothetical protein